MPNFRVIQPFFLDKVVFIKFSCCDCLSTAEFVFITFLKQSFLDDLNEVVEFHVESSTFLLLYVLVQIHLDHHDAEEVVVGELSLQPVNLVVPVYFRQLRRV